MMKRHHEHPENSGSKSALGLAIGATAVVLVIEVAGGIWTNSLALLSDAAHVFMDLLSFILTLWAILISERAVSDRRTYGWHRMEVFAALINALTVFTMAVLIFWQAVKRFAQPQPILSSQMLIIALGGLFVNLFVVWKLHPHVGEDVNVRSAFLHSVGDALASVTVVIGGALVLITNKSLIDPLAAMLVALIIVFGAYQIFTDSIHILMEGAPKGLDRAMITGAIEEIAGQQSVKDLHIWNLCSHLCTLSVHIVLPENQMSKQREILEQLNLNLEKKFNIVHTTIQIESDAWRDGRSKNIPGKP